MEILKKEMVLGQSKIIINFCINIIINTYYNDNCLNTSLYNYFVSNRILYFISNTVFMDECDKEEHLGVTVVAIKSYLTRKLRNFLSKFTYSLISRQDGVSVTSTLLTLPIRPDFRKNFSLAVRLGSNGNSNSISTFTYMFIHTHVFHNIETLVGHRNKNILGQYWLRAEETFSPYIWDTRAIVSGTLF